MGRFVIQINEIRARPRQTIGARGSRFELEREKAKSEMVTVTTEEAFIETVDAWQLRQVRMPIMRFVAPDFVAQLELGRYVKTLLSSGKWRAVRVVPHTDAQHGHLHQYDIYGEPRLPLS